MINNMEEVMEMEVVMEMEMMVAVTMVAVAIVVTMIRNTQDIREGEEGKEGLTTEEGRRRTWMKNKMKYTRGAIGACATVDGGGCGRKRSNGNARQNKEEDGRAKGGGRWIQKTTKDAAKRMAQWRGRR